MSLALFTQACSSPTETQENVNCPDLAAVQTNSSAILRNAITVFVRDSISDQPIGNSVTAIAADGDYVDSQVSPDRPDVATAALGLAPGRPGVYDLFVVRPGYTTWVSKNLKVSTGACGVIPLTVTAKLQRAP